MSSIKKLLEEYQNENSRLKIDNNELYEQYEMLRSNSDKLQMRYEESMAREEDIMTDLQSYMDEVNMLK
jgi:predicted RNase H-like nuclease (RuvC/YqgF family)